MRRTRITVSYSQHIDNKNIYTHQAYTYTTYTILCPPYVKSDVSLQAIGREIYIL